MDKALIMKTTGCSDTLAETFLPFIIETCDKYGINTKNREVAFLAQVGHESGSLFYTEELASGDAYNGRKDLGNTNPGDGPKYKGRGLIQITGKTNYKALSESFNIDFVGNPTLLGGKNTKVSNHDQLRYSTLSAGWFWNKTKLNEIADKLDLTKPATAEPNLTNFKLITKKINGGYNGLDDRQKRFDKGRI
jgi:putative chitinase